jgi:hypothetical protein
MCSTLPACSKRTALAHCCSIRSKVLPQLPLQYVPIRGAEVSTLLLIAVLLKAC